VTSKDIITKFINFRGLEYEFQMKFRKFITAFEIYKFLDRFGKMGPGLSSGNDIVSVMYTPYLVQSVLELHE
jgi:hypothetical protein